MPSQVFYPTKDTHIRKNLPNNNYGTGTGLTAGERNDGTDFVNRSLLYFDFRSIIPPGSTINSATLSIYETSEAANTSAQIIGYRVVREWNETECTWNDAKSGVSWGTAGCSNTSSDYNNTGRFSRSMSSNEAPGWKNFSFGANGIADLEDIINFVVPYEGYIMRGALEADDAHSFSSNDAASNKPYVTVDYTLPLGGAEQGIFIGL